MLHDRSIFPSRDADTDREHHTASPTAHLLDELALYGYRFGQDEPDPRRLPEPDAIQSQLDTNEQAQRRGQAEQDGSEVKSVELERLIAQGIGLIERRNAFEFFRDQAAELFEGATGSAWRPRSGSK